MTRPVIERRSPRPLANTLPISSMSRVQVGKVFTNGPEGQSQVKSYQRLKKWYFIPPCLTLSTIRYESKVKWSNSGEGVAPSLTPWCCSYWKGSLWFALNSGRQLYLLTTHKYLNTFGSDHLVLGVKNRSIMFELRL